MTEEKQRTTLQNRSLHKYFSLLAKELNEAGLDMKAVLAPSVDIPWTPENIKNHLWRPVQKVYANKESTAELTTKETTDIYEALNRHLAWKFGVTVSWPSTEEIMLRDLTDNN